MRVITAEALLAWSAGYGSALPGAGCQEGPALLNSWPCGGWSTSKRGKQDVDLFAVASGTAMLRVPPLQAPYAYARWVILASWAS